MGVDGTLWSPCGSGRINHHDDVFGVRYCGVGFPGLV